MQAPENPHSVAPARAQTTPRQKTFEAFTAVSPPCNPSKSVAAEAAYTIPCTRSQRGRTFDRCGQNDLPPATLGTWWCGRRDYRPSSRLAARAARLAAKRSRAASPLARLLARRSLRAVGRAEAGAADAGPLAEAWPRADRGPRLRESVGAFSEPAAVAPVAGLPEAAPAEPVAAFWRATAAGPEAVLSASISAKGASSSASSSPNSFSRKCTVAGSRFSRSSSEK